MNQKDKPAKKKRLDWNYGSHMSDNQKRAGIDEQLKLLYPDFTHAQIVREREEFLASKISYKYPLPEKRKLVKNTTNMSFDMLLSLYRDKVGSNLIIYYKYILGGIAFLALVGTAITLFLTLLIRISFIEPRIQMLVTFLLIAIVTFVIVHIIAKDIIEERRQIESAIKKRKIKIKCYRVLDTGTSDPEPGDESSHRTFYLILRDHNKKDEWRYSCGEEDYRKYRENDYICMAFSDNETMDKKRHFFTFHYAEWNYDEEMKSVLDKEIEMYQ